MLKKLDSFSAQNSYFLPDYTVESLKRIEKWYYDLYEKGKFHKVGFTRNKFERIMSVYFGEVAVKNNKDAKWLVEEYMDRDLSGTSWERRRISVTCCCNTDSFSSKETRSSSAFPPVS